MSEWKETTINDCCLVVTDGSHQSPKSVDIGKPMVSVKDFIEFGFDFENCRQISEEDYIQLEKNGCVPEIDDILIGKDGARYFEDVVIYKQTERPALLSSIAILRPDKTKVLPSFLYYLMKEPNFKQDVRANYASGSAIPRILLKDFKRMPVSFPPFPEQKAIADTLSILDRNIELNNQANQVLEEKAQAIFKNWFVDFEPFDGEMPEDWEVGTLSDFGTIVGGSTPSKAKEEYYTEQEIAWITPKDLSRDKSKFIGKGECDITELGLKNSSAKKMPRGTVLFSSRAPIGYIAIAKNEVTTNQGFKSVVPFEKIGSPFVYFFLKENVSLIESMGSGTTFKEVSASVMKSVPVRIPTDDILQEFTNLCEPLFALQEKNEEENQTLTQIRNTLLPKLMSGEVRVPLGEVE